jgi:hypothetical protein
MHKSQPEFTPMIKKQNEGEDNDNQRARKGITA